MAPVALVLRVLLTPTARGWVWLSRAVFVPAFRFLDLQVPRDVGEPLSGVREAFRISTLLSGRFFKSFFNVLALLDLSDEVTTSGKCLFVMPNILET